MRVGDVMTRGVAAVSPHASIREAARWMDQLNVGALPVCDGARLVASSPTATSRARSI